MTPQERKDFEKLFEFRKTYATLSQHEDYRNQWEVFTKLYSDKAHFVYELSQNADDARATRAEFILSNDKLIFKHNGTRKFNVTDPYNKPKSGHGDINAITAIANSNKNENDPVNQIGKFGIGFKAVFQYTDTPAIFDDNFAFRITNFIVPEFLENDHTQRKENETLFEFPFNKKGCTPETAYKEISTKLKSLDCPLLFLSNLKEIEFRFVEATGTYKKEINGNLVTQIKIFDGKPENQSLYLFSKQDDKGRNYSVGYFLDDKGRLKPEKKPAFCFFATKMDTGLNFIIHAPFYLSGTREGILASENHNEDMINKLATLAADSLLYLRDLKLIDDDILNIIPTNEADFDVAADEISFKPFYTKIRDKMENKKLLPTRNGDYVTRENAYWAEVKRYAEVFSDKQLQELVGDSRAAWVFTTISRRETNDKVKRSYIDDITHDFITEDKLFRFINETFIETQPIEWFKTFYEWLAEPKSDRISGAKYKPFFLNKDGKATAVYDDKKRPILFLPNTCGCPSVHPDLLANPDTEKFLTEKIGIREPSLEDEVYIKTRIENPLDLYASFIEDQTISWLHRFYKWIAKDNYRIKRARTRPFFLDENFRAVAAFKDGKPILFLPNDGGYLGVNDKLLANLDTKKFLTNDIGIADPSPEDYLNTKIRAKYENNSFTDDDFKKIFAYYEQCPRDKTNALFSGLKLWIKLRTLDGRYVAPNGLYMPAPPLIDCFKAVIVKDTDNPSRNNFLDVDFYLDLVGKNQANFLREFFKGVGVTDNFDDLKSRIKLRTLAGEYDAPRYLYMPEPDLIEYFDAANLNRNFLGEDYLNSFNDKDLMREFFKSLGIADEVKYFTKEIHTDSWWATRDFWNFYWDGIYEPEAYTKYYGLRWKETKFEGLEELTEDIVNNRDADKSFILWKRMVDLNSRDKLEDNLVGVCHYKQQGYYYDTKYAPVKVIQYLKDKCWLVDKQGNFKKSADILVGDMADDYDTTSNSAKEVIDFFGIPEPNLSAEQKELIERGKKYKEAEEKGINVDELIQKELMRRKEKESSPLSPSTREDTTTPPPQPIVSKKINPPPQIAPPKISKKTGTDYDRELEKIDNKNAAEKRKIQELKDLENKIACAKKYSFGWFKLLLDLEILKSNENKSGNKTVSISFGRVEFDAGTQRTLILKYPNRYIPQFMEDLENIPLVLHTAKTDIKVEIEVSGIRHNTLSVKLKPTQSLIGINLDDVSEARINVTEPFFLLEELQKRFNALDYPDGYDMQENLCANVDFVFGPPGTGKTYNLAQKIIAMMNEPKNRKILVLTPTNKAADVLVNKIIDLDAKKSYEDWLLRFGTTDDANVEKSGVFHDKTFDITSKRKNVTVTTIARFPYDFFMVNGGTYLRDIDWDCIIFDEASMIMLAQILLLLYMKKPEKFIVAGDPFQIDPITKADLWKEENIYKLVGLNSFIAPKTFPHNYYVEKLTTQYRSVPTIGNIFSKFTYGGIINHARADSEQRPLNIDDWLDVKTLNIIKFPVKAYESIYRSRRLNGRSSYHIYSAIFTFEFVKYLSERLAEKNSDEKFSIGIVAPYRAQADLIEKLFSTTKAPANIDIQIGTVHSFQGDECDILFAIFNTPPNISSAPEMFLNRQNIINVAISRARDYLFVIMPDDNTIRIENLSLVKEIEGCFADAGQEAGEFSAQDLEVSLFGKKDFIEENSFSTGHQNVNVYATPERKYEIRIEDSAVDVQLQKNF